MLLFVLVQVFGRLEHLIALVTFETFGIVQLSMGIQYIPGAEYLPTNVTRIANEQMFPFLVLS